MPIFRPKPKKKVSIEIIKTESLQGRPPEKPAPKAPPVRSDKQSEANSGIKINILGKQQLTTPEEHIEAAAKVSQVARELLREALPDIVLSAQKARLNYKIDEAFRMLREYRRKFETTSEIDDELMECRNALEDSVYFQKVDNNQLATILFESADFLVTEATRMRKPDANSIETRLTVACEDREMSRFLETIATSPVRYHCYSLAVHDKPLDITDLAALEVDFKKRSAVVNHKVHFIVCKGSRPDTNMVINVHRFTHGFTTIPLEREEIKRAIIQGTSINFIRGKVNAWMGDYRLFVATTAVAQEGEFFGREKLLKEITDIVERRQSFCLLGNRRMGKTSLILHLRNLGAFHTFLYAYINLADYLGEENFDRVILGILDQWGEDLWRKSRKLGEQVEEMINRIPAETPLDQLEAFLDVLLKIREEERELRCMVILDDITPTMRSRRERPSLWERGGERLLRLLRNKENIVVTGLTVWDFETLEAIESEYGGGMGKYAPIYVGPLNREECQTMVEYVGGIINMYFKPESLDALYAETGGHPYWTRLICDIISRPRGSSYEKLEISPDQVEQASQDFLALHTAALKELETGLKAGKLKMLRELALAGAPMTKQQISRFSSPQALTHLSYYGWIEKQPDECYSLRVHLLSRYFQSEPDR